MANILMHLVQAAQPAVLPNPTDVDTISTSVEWRGSVSEEFRAGLFMTGGSQAVRLPAACRFEGRYVRVRKEGSRVILEPMEKPKWPSAFWRWFDRSEPVSADFVVPAPLPAAPHRDAALGRFDDEA